jgi:hypothetical protein
MNYKLSQLKIHLWCWQSMLLLLMTISTYSSAQLANIDYSVRVDRIQSNEGGLFGPCWESGTVIPDPPKVEGFRSL